MRNLNFKKVITDIVEWIHSYCKTNNIDSLVVGVSGGIDSSLVSTLCSMTGIKTYLILLPLNQPNGQTELGESHIEWLMGQYPNVSKIKIDLSNIFTEFKSTFKNEKLNELSLANTKSRIRMTALYLISQNNNGIVVGTGNKVEDFGVGFFTKYGDGGVDISPIADLYKSEVYELCKILKINEEIISSKPTDGLWEDGRNDEEQIGATYDEIEWIMENYNHIFNLELNERQTEVLKIYENLNNKNKHKMINIPIFKIQ
jgi:NAD+ synthase